MYDISELITLPLADRALLAIAELQLNLDAGVNLGPLEIGAVTLKHTTGDVADVIHVADFVAHVISHR